MCSIYLFRWRPSVIKSIDSSFQFAYFWGFPTHAPENFTWQLKIDHNSLANWTLRGEFLHCRQSLQTVYTPPSLLMLLRRTLKNKSHIFFKNVAPTSLRPRGRLSVVNRLSLRCFCQDAQKGKSWVNPASNNFWMNSLVSKEKFLRFCWGRRSRRWKCEFGRISTEIL